MLRTILIEKNLRAKPEDFYQLIKSKTEIVLSILKNLSMIVFGYVCVIDLRVFLLLVLLIFVILFGCGLESAWLIGMVMVCEVK